MHAVGQQVVRGEGRVHVHERDPPAGGLLGGDDGQERLVPTSLWYSDPTAPFRAAKSLAKTAFFKANDADSFPSEAAYKKAAEEEGLKAYAAAYAKAKAKLLLRAHDADAAISGDEDQE